jgi:hypothetical protein
VLADIRGSLQRRQKKGHGGLDGDPGAGRVGGRRWRRSTVAARRRRPLDSGRRRPCALPWPGVEELLVVGPWSCGGRIPPQPRSE